MGYDKVYFADLICLFQLKKMIFTQKLFLYPLIRKGTKYAERDLVVDLPRSTGMC